MAEGKDRKAWDIAASLIAVQVNANIDTRKQKPYSVYKFHPYPPAEKQNKSDNGVADVARVGAEIVRKSRYD